MVRNHFIGFFAILFFSFFPGRITLAQNSSSDGNIIISEVIEAELSNADEESDPELLAQEMSNFLEHPLNLNSASAEELRQLKLLTEFQIYALRNYIHENGGLLSVYELQLIYGFDRELISRILPFIVVTPGNIQAGKYMKVKNSLRQTLRLRAELSGKCKTGSIADSGKNTDFEGANRSLLLRYEVGFSKFRFGVIAEQDAGESFYSGGKRFQPDFISGFLEYSGKGLVKKIIIGDYKGIWGQGLILGGFGAHKGSQVLISPQSTGLKKYSSSGENDFFRGAGASIGWHKISLELFASHMNIDAALHEISNDSLTSYFFTSPDLSGLHRSIKELEKKDAIICNIFGGHAQIAKNFMTIGFSYLNQQYGNEWRRNSTAYTHEIFPAGSRIQNFGTDFKASLGKIAVFGELASDIKVRTAIFTGILAELHPLARLSMVYRNYQPDYLGLRSSGFGESRGTKNEEGYYLGLQIYPWKYLKADLYADHYSFPFLRYNSTNPYSGNDYMINIACTPSPDFSVNMRLKYEKNQNRSSASITGIDRMKIAQKGGSRFEMTYLMNKNLKLKSRFEFSYYKNAEKPVTEGFYSAHDLNLQSNSQKYNIWIRYAIYDIPEWENRIYAYENDVLGSFTVPAFSSKGARFIVIGKAELFPGFELSIRYALSQFQEKRTQGSGNDEVCGGSELSWTLQLRYKY